MLTLHAVQVGGGVEFFGVVQVIPGVLDDGLEQLIFLQPWSLNVIVHARPPGSLSPIRRAG